MGTDKFRALVVDDEALLRRLLAASLRSRDFDCDEATDGADAIELIEKSRYDVVVTDLKMPNKNGHAFASEVLTREPRPLVVVFTGVLEPRLAEDLLKRGVDDIVYKPTDYGVLAAKIRNMVERWRTSSLVDTMPAPLRAAWPQGSNEQDTANDEQASPGDPVTLTGLNAKLSQLSSLLPISPGGSRRTRDDARRQMEAHSNCRRHTTRRVACRRCIATRQ